MVKESQDFENEMVAISQGIKSPLLDLCGGKCYHGIWFGRWRKGNSVKYRIFPDAIEAGYPPVTNMLKKEYEVQKDE